MNDVMHFGSTNQKKKTTLPPSRSRLQDTIAQVDSGRNLSKVAKDTSSIEVHVDISQWEASKVLNLANIMCRHFLFGVVARDIRRCDSLSETDLSRNGSTSTATNSKPFYSLHIPRRSVAPTSRRTPHPQSGRRITGVLSDTKRNSMATVTTFANADLSFMEETLRLK